MIDDPRDDRTKALQQAFFEAHIALERSQAERVALKRALDLLDAGDQDALAAEVEHMTLSLLRCVKRRAARKRSDPEIRRLWAIASSVAADVIS